MKPNFTWKIWILIFVVLLSLLAIFGFPPKFLQGGVEITSVEQNSSAFEQGLRQGQIITAIDGKAVNSLEGFSNTLSGRFLTNSSEKITITTQNSGEFILFIPDTPKITVSEIPDTNIKFGLDIAGGSRALVKAQEKSLSSSELDKLVSTTSNRLNEFGISDVRVTPVSDLSGDRFMLVEIAGATPDDIEELLSQQGKFEAKIGNKTVFIGGERDVASVSRDARSSGIESCNQANTGEYFCNFRFVVYLSQNAAERHAEITRDLSINTTAQGNYLSKNLDLYLDDRLVDSLRIGEGLRGRTTTQIQISGSETGPTRDDAFNRAEESMHKLQTVLVTGSLPFKLEIVKLDTISPVLGEDFIRSMLIAGLSAMIFVALVIFVRYRKIKPSLALLITSVSEVLIILGIASLIRWNLDLPSIAGILVTIGTGIDQQIVILDESRQKISMSIKQKLKRAFTIILGAYFTIVVAMLPLLWAGAGLLKGFAITTIIGITAGVLITRPAFSDMLKKIGE